MRILGNKRETRVLKEMQKRYSIDFLKNCSRKEFYEIRNAIADELYPL